MFPWWGQKQNTWEKKRHFDFVGEQIAFNFEYQHNLCIIQ